MKFKFLTALFFVLLLGVNVGAQAQQEEGEDFWTEEEASTETAKTADDKANATSSTTSARVKPVDNSCTNKNELREEVRLLIRPFKYNLAKTTIVNYKRYPQLLRVLIPIYSEEQHRIIFSTKGLPQDVIITVYDKQQGEKKRKALFTSNPSEPISTFELPEDYKESFLFVEYSVPPTDAEDRSTTRRGCVIMMMGYLYLPTESGESTVETGTGKKKKK
tara:strand:+ start:9680 stop:10336 length:657 start_codon:yes stop_codon:yes gene_type:complete